MSNTNAPVKIKPWLSNTIGAMVFVSGILTIIGSIAAGIVMQSWIAFFCIITVGIAIIVGTIQYTKHELGWKCWDR